VQPSPVASATTLVIKVGSSLVTNEGRGLDRAAIARWAAQVAELRAAGKRCVLVITGHGRISGGVLKASVPRWLAEPELRRHVLAIAPAQPQHGGAGALYLLLRRPAP